MATELKYKILLLNDLKHQSIIKFFDSFNKINSGYNFISFKKEIKDTIGILNRDLDFLVDFLVTSKKLVINNDKMLIHEKILSKDLFNEFKTFYINKLISNEQIKRNLFLKPKVDYDKNKVIINRDSIPRSYRLFLISLSEFKLMKWIDDNTLVINDKDLAKLFTFSNLRRLKIISQDEYDKILEIKKVRGNLAEEFVLEYEENKLKKINKKPIRVSQLDVGLGYDIKSYDLETKKEIFIEVKSVSDNSLIWTNNEVNVSREKKDQYYIYCVSFDGNKPDKISLKIKNPYKKVFIDKVYKFQEKDFTIYFD